MNKKELLKKIKRCIEERLQINHTPKNTRNLRRAISIAVDMLNEVDLPDNDEYAMVYLQKHVNELIKKWVDKSEKEDNVHISENTIRVYTAYAKQVVRECKESEKDFQLKQTGGRKMLRVATKNIQLESGRFLAKLPWNISWKDVQIILTTLVRHNPDVWVLLERWDKERSKIVEVEND